MKIIDNIADWFVILKKRNDVINNDITTFMKRGKNAFIVWALLFGLIFLYMSFDLYKNYGKLWIALIPISFFIIFILGVSIFKSYKSKLKQHNRNPKMKLVGLNLDFNERILRKIYGSLIRYSFLDENLNRFDDFYNVLVLDFHEHESELHFSCKPAQLKYILEKFKPYKKGVHLSTFERSEKIYNNQELIKAKKLYKRYSKNPPTQKFEKLIDSFFIFVRDI